MAKHKDPFEQALSQIDAGLVLDVATGQGGFAEVLTHNLRSYAQIVGVDLSRRMLAGAVEKAACRDTRFIQMHAGRLAFMDAAFDTVSLSASLHHLADPPAVLAEIDRALKPGGSLIVAEMHRDATTEAQMTSVLIHQWAAAVDVALGWPHYPTLSRQQIIDLIAPLDLREVAIYDWAELDSDPLDEDTIEELADVFDRYLPRARALPDYVKLKAQAGTLRQRLRDTGAQDEPRTAIIGRKPA